MTAPERAWIEFVRRRDGMRHALQGGLWFHQHVWKGERMAHLVSSDRERLLEAGCQVLMPWGAPIGSGQGLRNIDGLRSMRAHFPDIPLVVDAGMNDLLRPALYKSFHSLKPVRVREGSEVVDVVGPICESTDFLAQDREISPMEAGDLLAVMSAGAYAFSLASNYNSRPRPAEVLVDGDQFEVVGRRETYEDLIRLERVGRGAETR